MTIQKTDTVFPKEDCTFLLQGPAGALETVINYPAHALHRTIAVICHPHPLQQGTLHNKIVTTLHKVFQTQGATTVRFNYRGVGKSQGAFGHGEGEYQDLCAVVAAVRAQWPAASLVLAGFSFGGYIALKGAVQLHPALVVTVAPAIYYPDIQTLPAIDCPWIVAQGDQDSITPLTTLTEWLALRQASPVFLQFEGVDHFFHGQLIALRERLLENLPPL